MYHGRAAAILGGAVFGKEFWKWCRARNGNGLRVFGEEFSRRILEFLEVFLCFSRNFSYGIFL
mgnify:CR=1 FL=1